MLVCGAFVGAAVVTVGWMIGISYVDYLVAQYGRFGKRAQRLTVERLFAMPWNRMIWLASGGGVFAVAFLSGLLGFGGQVFVSVVGVAVVGFIVLSDWQQLRSRQARPETASGAPEPTMSEAWLRGVRGEYTGREIWLSHRRLTIGRSAGSALRLTDRSVSRRHAIICFAQGRWFLQDRDSTIGTFVNGQRVRATALNHGDRIRIGPAEFEFRLRR
jgi:hypothetical protein